MSSHPNNSVKALEINGHRFLQATATGCIASLSPNQQCQCTEGRFESQCSEYNYNSYWTIKLQFTAQTQQSQSKSTCTLANL